MNSENIYTNKQVEQIFHLAFQFGLEFKDRVRPENFTSDEEWYAKESDDFFKQVIPVVLLGLLDE